MKIWRLTKEKYLKTCFDGKGAADGGGRWNWKGTKMVYTSGNRSLTVLETLVQIRSEQAPPKYFAVPADIPDDLLYEELSIDNLPNDWDNDVIPDSTRNIGTEWARSRRTAVLIVPSTVGSGDRNVLVNPLHPDFQKIAKHTDKAERVIINYRLRKLAGWPEDKP